MREIIVSDPGDEQAGTEIVKMVYESSMEDFFYQQELNKKREKFITSS